MARHCDRLKEALKIREMKPSVLSYKTDISEASISHYIAGHYVPKAPKMKLMAQALRVSELWLSGYDVPMEDENNEFINRGLRQITRKKLPMLGNVACGEPIFANEERESYVDTDADIDADFCLTAKGDSMINARIFDGDILFIKQQPMVDDGEIAVALIDDEATVKRVYYDRENAILTLMPENPTYKPMRYSGDHLNAVRILGKVVCGQYDVR